jgi:hypothetical protein
MMPASKLALPEPVLKVFFTVCVHIYAAFWVEDK